MTSQVMDSGFSATGYCDWGIEVGAYHPSGAKDATEERQIDLSEQMDLVRSKRSCRLIRVRPFRRS